MRVAAGAVARKYLRERAGIVVRGYLAQLGPIRPAAFDWDEVERNPFFCPDPGAAEEMARFMDALRKSGDSIGARIDVVASGVPPGLGEPVFDRLDADLAHALMSINAVKGVEIGAGFRVVEMRGTENRDEITPEGFLQNNAGGVLGGISSGQDIRASIALKPTSSLRLPGRSIDAGGNPVEVVTHGRHDPCVGIRATPIAEAMVAIVLMDHYLRHPGGRVLFRLRRIDGPGGPGPGRGMVRPTRARQPRWTGLNVSVKQGRSTGEAPSVRVSTLE